MQLFETWKLKQKISARVQKKKEKAHQKNMSRESTLKFDQWKTFSENYKLVKVWLWFVYIINEKNFRLVLFTKRNRTSLKKSVF